MVHDGQADGAPEKPSGDACVEPSGERSAHMTTVVTPPAIGDLAGLIPSWRRSLTAEGKSPRTIQSYEEASLQFVAFLRDAGMPTPAASIRREHVEAFLVALG